MPQPATGQAGGPGRPPASYRAGVADPRVRSSSNQTILPGPASPCRSITPQRSASASTMWTPRPLLAEWSIGRTSGRAGDRSAISTWRRSSSAATWTWVVEPAWITALVTSSLTNSPAVSRSTPVSPSRSAVTRCRARRGASEPGSSSKCASISGTGLCPALHQGRAHRWVEPRHLSSVSPGRLRRELIDGRGPLLRGASAPARDASRRRAGRGRRGQPPGRDRLDRGQRGPGWRRRW